MKNLIEIMMQKHKVLLMGVAILLLLAAIIVVAMFRRREPARTRLPTPLVQNEIVGTDADIRFALDNYRRWESRRRRGAAFARLAHRLTLRHAAGATYSEADVVDYLGAPDLRMEADGVRSYAYFYDRGGVQDGVVEIDISNSDRVLLFGWNDRKENDYFHPAWQPFEKGETE